MAFSVKQGSFTAPTSAATNTVVTGLGFVPKALLCWASLATADGYLAGASQSFGFASGSAVGNQRCPGFNFADNVATTDTARAYFDGVLAIPNTGGSADLWEARLSSFDADGFTLDWVTVQATGIIVHWLALGGADLTNVEVGDVAAAVATGDQVVSTGFQGDCVIFLTTINTTAAPTFGTTSRGGIGAAQSSSKRWCNWLTVADAQTMGANIDALKTQRTDSCIVTIISTGTQDALADFVSFNATPSFTINWSDAPGVAYRLAYLLLKGGQYDVGAFNKTTSAAPVNQDVTAPGFQPTGVLLTSFNNAATTTITADAERSVGGFDAAGNEGSAWIQHKDVTVNTEANASIISTKALRLAESVSTTDSEADSSMLSNGFRLSWTTNLTSKADEICYVAFGSTPAAGGATRTRTATGVGK